MHVLLCGDRALAEQIKLKSWQSFCASLLQEKKQNMWGHVEHVEQLGGGGCVSIVCTKCQEEVEGAAFMIRHMGGLLVVCERRERAKGIKAVGEWEKRALR